MVYEGEGLTVDLRFERKPHSNGLPLPARSSTSKCRLVQAMPPSCFVTDGGQILATDLSQ